MRFLLPAVAALVPLIIAPPVLFYYDVTPKIVVLLIGTALALLLVSNDRAPSRWFAILLAAQGLSLAVSTALSSDPALSITGSNWRRFGFLTYAGLLLFTFLAASYLAGDRERLRPLLRAVTVSGALVAFYGVLQYFGWDPLLPVEGYHAGEGVFAIVRSPATLGHAGYFATYLVYVVFAGMGWAWLEGSGVARRIAIGSAGFAVLAIVLSGTRAALLGLVVGALVLLVWLRPRIRLRAAVVGVVTLAALAVFYYSPSGERLRARMHWSIEEPAGGARFLLWRDALRMGLTRPIFGNGPETFGSEFPRVQSIELARAYPDFYHESPHNVFLDALTSQGMVGMIILATLIGLGFRRATPLLAAALAAGLVCQQFTSFTLPTALCLYLTLAVAASFAPEAGVVRIPRWVAGAAALVLSGFAFQLLMADASLAVVKSDFATGDLDGAAAAYDQAQRWAPRGMNADLYYSRSMALHVQKVQNMDLAVRAMAAAVRATQFAEDRQNAFYNLATFQAAQNNAGAVEQSLRAAITRAPNWYKPHWMLAQVLRVGGRLAEAEQEAAAAVARDGGKHPEVAKTWDEIRGAGPRLAR